MQRLIESIFFVITCLFLSCTAHSGQYALIHSVEFTAGGGAGGNSSQHVTMVQGSVVQVSTQTFPVHRTLLWFNCTDDVRAGWSFNGTSFAPPAPEPQPTIAEWRQTAEVGPYQLALVLTEDNMLASVETWVTAQGGLVEFAWRRATVFKRMDPFILQAQTAFGLTPEQMDDIFRRGQAK